MLWKLIYNLILFPLFFFTIIILSIFSKKIRTGFYGRLRSKKIINDFETYVAPQQNQTRQRNYNWGALSDLGKDLSESFGGRSLQPRTKICNFKSFEGAIISGDCSQTAINSGGTTYWKLN